MANTVKVLGSGPLAGRTFYTTVVAVKPAWVALDFDAPGPFGFFIGEFCPRTGALLVPDAQGDTTDLLHVDLADMPRFSEMVALATV